MSEIEELYENAKVKKQIPKVCSSNELYCKECEAHIEDAMPYCKNAEYPPFTAEKQIAILKLLTQQCDLTISHFGEWEFIHYDGQEPLEITGKDFTETFAKLINAYWQSLTEEDRTEIAEILN